MKLAGNIKGLIKSLHDTTSEELDERVLKDVLKALEESKGTKSAASEPNIWREIMKSRITKLAGAAVVIIMVIVSINQLDDSIDGASVPAGSETAKFFAAVLNGPQSHRFDDSSVVTLAEDAKIRLYNGKDKRGFEHVAGEIDVVVAKGQTEFVVTTSFGNVKALGTAFKMDLISAGLQNGTGKTEILAVKVKEGSVEVSNPQGVVIIKENQGATVERDKEPYDFRQDENLPPRLIERIESMLIAMETGDKRAYLANYNIKALYDLAKGKIKFTEHRDWFSGMSDDDAQRFIQGFLEVNSQDELVELALSGISDKTYKLYVRSVTLDKDGKHAMAVCVKKLKQVEGFTPQWTYFEGDWWQTDD